MDSRRRDFGVTVETVRKERGRARRVIICEHRAPCAASCGREGAARWRPRVGAGRALGPLRACTRPVPLGKSAFVCESVVMRPLSPSLSTPLHARPSLFRCGGRSSAQLPPAVAGRTSTVACHDRPAGPRRPAGVTLSRYIRQTYSQTTVTHDAASTIATLFRSS